MDGEGDYPTLNLLSQIAKGNGCWRLEWTRIRRHPSDHNRDVKPNSETSQANEGVCDRRVDGPHVSAQTAGEKKEGRLEHHGKTLDEEVQRPLLQPIELALTVPAALDHRPARISQVSVQPLLAQHGDECGQQGDNQARVHEAGDRDRLARRISLNRQGGRSLARDGGLVESEENRAEKGGGLLVRIGLEVRVDVDDEGGADGGEQTGLQERVR